MHSRMEIAGVVAAVTFMTLVGAPQPPVAARVNAFESGVGSKIAFTTDRDGRDASDEIYVMNADGTDEVRLTFTTSGNCIFPEWSPDGRTIAFHLNPTELGGRFEIFVVEADGSGATRRLTDMSALGLSALNATWSPDGKRIAFNSQDAAGNRDLWAINLDGTGLTRLTSDPANEANPDWSPDGRTIAFNSNRSGNPDIYLMSADGAHDANDWVRLTFEPTGDISPDWSPNGRWIAFETLRDGNREIYVMSPDGTNQIRLTHDPRNDAFPSWAPDGRQVAFNRQVVSIAGFTPPNGSEIFAIDVNTLQETRLTARTPESFSAFASWAAGRAKE